MDKTIFRVIQMDCPSEESLIRMQLDHLESVKSLDFDIPNRKVVVFHEGGLDKIVHSIKALNLGSSVVKTEELAEEEEELLIAEDAGQKKLLWIVLAIAINFTFFVLEFTTGFLADSMGLVADSLEMLADALVYGLSLFAIGSTVSKKKRTARISGYLQLTLAVIGLVEVIRRFIGMEELPEFQNMINYCFHTGSAGKLSFTLLIAEIQKQGSSYAG